MKKEGLLMTITIRPIKQQDNPAIEQIIKHILEEHHLDVLGTAYFDPQLGHLYEHYKVIPNGEYWVILEGDIVIGGVGIGPFGEYKDIAELQKYYLKKEYQGLGYGRRLFTQAINFVKKHNYSKLYLETSDLLGEANQIYRHLGFKSLEKPLDGSDHPLMNRWFIKDI